MKNKVLFVATVTGHINVFHLPYLKLFKDRNWEVTVVTGDEKKVQNCCDNKYSILIRRNPFSFKNIYAIKQLKKILDNEKFDIIHCHTPMGGVVTRIASKNARKKYGTRVIYTAHGFHFYKGAPLLNWLIFYPIEWYLSKYTDTLITINKEDYELAKRRFGKRCKDIQYVPGVGIDSKKFQINMSEEQQLEFKKSLGLDKNDFVLTCVARLDKNKNQGFLINVISQLVKEKSNIHLLLVGSDELDGRYQSLTKQKGLEKNIHFLGKRDDIPEILNITNVVVSASKREGLPVNILEALICGVPVVALNCRGVEDLKENKNEITIVNSNLEFVEAVKQYYNNKAMDNKNKLEIKFDVKNIIRDYEKIYFNKLKQEE